MKIKLHPLGQELDGDPNRTLLQICLDNKVEIKSICKGVPSCSECRVKILAGEHNVIPPNKTELNMIGTNYFMDGRRLACQIRAFGDISVDISEHLEKDDNNTKKLRGYRPQPGRQTQSNAVQGTLVLQENVAPAGGGGGGENQQRPPRGEGQQNQQRQNNQRNQQKQQRPQQQAKAEGGPQEGSQQQQQKAPNASQSGGGQGGQAQREGGGGNRNRNRNRNRRGGGGGGGQGGGGKPQGQGGNQGGGNKPGPQS